MNIENILLHQQLAGIYCIINEQDKKVHIEWSTNLLNNFVQVNQKILSNKEIQEDRNKLSIRFIETYTHKHKLYLKYRVDELYREYIDMGYTPYSSYKPLGWTMFVSLETDESGRLYPVIRLRTSFNRSYIACIPATIQEAYSIIETKTVSDVVRLL